MKKFLAMAVFAITTILAMNGQTYETRFGKANDTINADSSVSTVFSVLKPNMQYAMVLTELDSIDGTPGGTVNIMVGVNNNSFLDTISTATYVLGNDTSYVAIDDTVSGGFIKWEFTSNSTAQTTQYKVVLLSVDH